MAEGKAADSTGPLATSGPGRLGKKVLCRPLWVETPAAGEVDTPLPVEGSQLEAEQQGRQEHCQCRLRGSHEGCQLCQDRWLNMRGFKFGAPGQLICWDRLCALSGEMTADPGTTRVHPCGLLFSTAVLHWLGWLSLWMWGNHGWREPVVSQKQIHLLITQGICNLRPARVSGYELMGPGRRVCLYKLLWPASGHRYPLHQLRMEVLAVNNPGYQTITFKR